MTTSDTLSTTETTMRTIGTALLSATFLTACWVFLPELWDYADLPKHVVVSVGILTTALWFAALGVWRGGAKIDSVRVDVLFLVLVGWIFLSIAWSTHAPDAVRRAFHYVICLIAYGAVRFGIRSDRDMLLFLRVAYLSAASLAVLGLLQHIGVVTSIPQTRMPSTTFANRNMTVHVLVVVLPFAFPVYRAARREWRRIGYAACFGIISAYLYHTGTRSGWVAAFLMAGTAVGLAAAEALRYRRESSVQIGDGGSGGEEASPVRVAWSRLRAPLVGLVVFILLTFLGAGRWSEPTIPKTERFTSIFTETAAAVSQAASGDDGPNRSNPRIPVWRNSLAMISDHPLVGVGIGGYRSAYPRYGNAVALDRAFSLKRSSDHAHNDYLELTAEIGILGILLLLVLGGAVVTLLYRAQRRVSETIPRSIVQAILLSLVGFAVIAFFSFPTYKAVPPFLVSVLLAFGVNIAYRTRRPLKRLSVSRRTAAVAAVGLSGLLVVTGVWGVHQLLADAHYLRMAKAERRSTPQIVIHEGRLAFERDRRRVDAFSYIGKSYIELGRLDQALAAFDRVLRYEPYQLNVLQNRGIAAYMAGKLDLATRSYRKVIELNPRVPDAHHGLGLVYLRRGNPEEAVVAIDRAVSLRPRNTEFRYHLSVALMSAQRYTDAVHHFGRVLELNENHALSHLMLGRLLCEELGRPVEGAVHLRRFLELEPDHRLAEVAAEVLSRCTE